MKTRPATRPQPKPGPRCWIDAAALLLLCAQSLIMYRQIALTNLILPGVDAIAYFYPYRAYAADAIRSGRIPLWNPYLFLGVPFLANPQTGVFYPPNLLLTWLLPAGLAGLDGAPRLVAWSLVLHVALAACGAYLYARRILRLSPLPALLGGGAFAFGGFLSGQAEHVNQLNVSAWFPLLLLLWEARHRAYWPALLGLGGVIGVGLLAGHTQSSYITLAGLAVYAIAGEVLPRRHRGHGEENKRSEGMKVATPPGRGLEHLQNRHGGHGEEEKRSEGMKVLTPSGWGLDRLRNRFGAQRGFAAPGRGLQTRFEQQTLRVLHASVPPLLRVLCVSVVPLLVGVGLAAVQLVPTLELSRLSIRSGGLSYREAVAFSLRPLPRLLRYTFLPAWGANLSDILGGDFYTEYVAYIGVLPLLLAVLACLAWARRIVREGSLSLHEEQSRATAQMILLAALGVFLALGLYNPLYWVLFKVIPGFGMFRVPARWLLLYAFGAAMLAGTGLHHASCWLRSRLGQAGASGTPEGGRQTAPWLRRAALALLLLVGWVELLLGAQALPLTHPTAPEAFSSLRTAPAHILAAQGRQQAPGRFISLSHTLFDPGDLAEIEQIYGDQLPPEAIYDLVVNIKRQEILAPNLPLAWRIYAVDGYDGGVLPLARYIELQRLLLDEEDILSDGRLREGLERIPPSRLLSILGVQYAITDKVHDVWIDDVFYDLAFETVLSAAATPSVEGDDLPRFAATALGIVTRLEGAQGVADGTRVAQVRLTSAEGETWTDFLRAGIESAEGGDSAATLSWAESREVTQIEIAALPFGPEGTGQIHVRGASLIDARDRSNMPVILSNEGRFRQVHSGDVKVYEALDVLPRAYAVHHTRVIAADGGHPNDEAALEAMLDPAFDPARTAILAGGREIDERRPGLPAPAVTVLAYEPEAVVVSVSLSAPGYLVLSDSWYPGWEVTVDGQPAVVERANVAFRAVYVPEGTHTVRWAYRPQSYRVGLWISAATLLGVVAALVALTLRRKRGS